MKPILIVMSHGNMAKETLASAQMITGDIADAYYVAMEAMDGLEGTKEKLNTLLTQHNNKEMIIIVDLFGGTPFNIANILTSENENVRIITGLNLAMIIDYALSTEENIDTLATLLINDGKAGIQIVEINNDDCDVDE